jgi:hypothetical protein
MVKRFQEQRSGELKTKAVKCARNKTMTRFSLVSVHPKDLRHHKETPPYFNHSLKLSGKRAFESVEFNSTIYVNSNGGEGTIGVVFGFQSAKVFYVVMWKKAYPNVGLVVKVRIL